MIMILYVTGVVDYMSLGMMFCHRPILLLLVWILRPCLCNAFLETKDLFLVAALFDFD
jgi:hypothetical protein